MKVGDIVQYVGNFTPQFIGKTGEISLVVDEETVAVNFHGLPSSAIPGNRAYVLRENLLVLEERVSPGVYRHVNEQGRTVVANQPQTVPEVEEDTKPSTALEIAQSLVYGDRGASYGHPKHDYDRTAKIITGILSKKLKDGEEIDAKEAILIMIGVKMSRLINTPTHEDSIVDIAGYAECYDRVRKFEDGDEDS